MILKNLLRGASVLAGSLLLASAVSAESLYPEGIYLEEDIVCALDSAVFALGDTEKDPEDERFTGTYGYNSLAGMPKAEAMQKFYREIDNKAIAFHHSTIDMQTLLVFRVDHTALGLNIEEASQVYKLYRNDHPLYFWISSSWAKSDTELICMVVPEYAAYSARKQAIETVESKVDTLLQYTEGETSPYRIALAYHDIIIDAVDYAYESDGITPQNDAWAHNIIGVLEEQGAVCEGYARTFQLLLNARGVENIFITGKGANEDHAWNLVRLEDGGWYWCDLTWDDRPDWMWGVQYNYFCVNDTESVSWIDGSYSVKGNDTFLTKHLPDTSGNTGMFYLYDLPDRAAEPFDGTEEVKILRDTFSDGVFEYAMVGYNAVQIIGINSTSADLVLPESVTYTGAVYDVISIGALGSDGLLDAASPVWSGVSPETVSIPKTMRFIWNDAFSPNTIKSFSVDPANEWFKSENGVLFTRSGWNLIRYPDAASAKEYSIPAGTYEIEYQAFRSPQNLEKLTMGPDVQILGNINGGRGYPEDKPSGIGRYVMSGQWRSIWHSLNGDAVIAVDSANSVFRQIGGAIYSENGTVLEYAADKSVTELILPEGVKTVRQFAVEYCGNLETIVIPASCTSVGANAFNDNPNLSDVYFLGKVPSEWGTAPFINSQKVLTIHCDPAKDPAWKIPEWTDNRGYTYPTARLTSEENGKAHIHSLSSWTDIGVKHSRTCLCGYEVSFRHCDYGGDYYCDICAAEMHYCGGRVIWAIRDGVLCLAGEGSTWDFSETGAPTWYYDRFGIEKVVIEEGVQSVGSFLFYCLPNVTDVILPSTVKTIGQNVFRPGNAPERIFFAGDAPDGIDTISSDTLLYCLEGTSGWEGRACGFFEWITDPETGERVPKIIEDQPGDEPAGVTVCGSVKSYGKAEDPVTVSLIPEGGTEAKYFDTVTQEEDGYVLEGVLPGRYTLVVEKKNHATRRFAVEVREN